MSHNKIYAMQKSRSKNILALLLIFPLISAEFEVCNPGRHEAAVYKFTRANCPFGVLFDSPITAYCIESTTETEYFISDLCDSDNSTMDSNVKPVKIQLAFKINEEALGEGATCVGEDTGKCNVTASTEATTQTMTEPKVMGCDPDEDEPEVVEGAEETKENQNDTLVANQTERLFKYMLDITNDPTAVGPDLRVVKILKQTFKIFGKFCDSRYVPSEFGKEVLKAFLYLFRESDKFGFKDISVDDYKSIKKTLDMCEKLPKLFTLNGQTCKSCANIHSIEKNGKSRRYIPDELSFEWGKYDVPTDATWSVINFVHGFCYGNYMPHVNYHHLYTREMERLYPPMLIRRWGKPLTLYHEDLWDHVFSANAKNAMKNIDVCITAAYMDTPFLHRLERPNLNQDNETESEAPPPPPTRRRKRSLSPMVLDEGGLEGAGWCFQSEEDMLETVKSYVQVHCPGNNKIVDDIANTLKEDAAPPPASPPEEGFEVANEAEGGTV